MKNHKTAQLLWQDLLTPLRRKAIDSPKKASMNTGGGRSEFERDFDRILFAAPTRRLADKTQVFPLEPNDSVRNRLTHSYEVANLARSIGVLLAYEHRHDVFGDFDKDQLTRGVPAILGAIGLAHDIGNPPFGHQGEKAIQQWFKDHENRSEASVHSDFKQFNGNAQSFRLLTRLQILNDNYGLNLTCATLSALMKYPCRSTGEKGVWGEKFCVNQSEFEIAEVIWNATGLQEGVRHPLAYIMEACDDIAYSVIDAEDTVKKGYASFNDLVEHLQRHTNEDTVTQKVLSAAVEKHNEAAEKKLSSGELNDISMQYFRVFSIHEMIQAALRSFIQNLERILKREPNNLELIKSSEAASFCTALKKFDLNFGFTHPSVLELELHGDRLIRETMNYFWEGISCRITHKETPFSRYAYGLISENYRRVFETTCKDMYAQHQLLTDAISGMTDGYLVSIHRSLKSLRDGNHELRRRRAR